MIPSALKKGGVIGIVSPGSPMKPDRLHRGLEYLHGLGYQTRLGAHVYGKQGYLAGGDEERAADLNAMFADQEVDAIFCTRGGYGTPRILDKLDYDLIASNPKILVGYSDITALHLALYQKSGLVTFAGPMPAVEMGQGIDAFTEEHFWSMLAANSAGKKLICMSGAEPGTDSGSVRGTLLGGNLSMLCTLVGTEYLPGLTGAILFLEEVGEQPYRIDRKFAQLRLAGIIDELAAIVIGQLTDCKPSPGFPSLSLAEIIAGYTEDLDIPVLTGLPHGHEAVKYTIPIGVEACLHGQEGSIELLTSPVA